MIGKKISQYKIIEELGSGGMGVVYKAEDLKLKRTVALKFVVPRVLKKQEDKERFIREAQTAACLNHPHICTIYQIEEVEDSTFIVMEYVEGRSLKGIIEKGPLKVEKALDFAIQIAEALEAAQEKNIIHRDIKSSNIMITPRDQVKIMDFGLAKVVSESQLTETASIMGTVAYMSPEQACGGTLDHRSDIWSLGVVMYEMLSGHVPFQGEHEQLVLYSILNKYHEPISALRSNIPYEMERIMDKCLEKDPTERYQHANELLVDLRRLKKETESGITPRPRPFLHKRRMKKLKSLVIPGIFVLVTVFLAAGYFLFDWFRPPPQRKTSIAVLPIEDMSSQEENEALCLYTTKDIIRKISLLSDELRVVTYDLVMIHNRQDKPSVSIGQELNVEFVLDSSLLSDGNRLQINADLISVKDNSVKNTFKYETSEQTEVSILDIQDNISKAIVTELGIHFRESGLIAAKKGEPQNDDAYNWYVKGMHVVDTQDTYPNAEHWFALATRMFKNAINLEPDYALAFWGLGAAHEAYYNETGDEEDLEQTIVHFEKAYALNPSLAETNLGSGWAHFYMGDFDKAHMRFKRALELDPMSPLINCDVGSFLASVGLFYRAIDYYSISIQLDPAYSRADVLNAKCQWYVGEFETGAGILKRLLDYQQDDFYMHREYANHLMMLGSYDKAEEELSIAEKLRPGSTEANHALLHAHLGEADKALAYVQNIKSTHHYVATCIYSILGKHDEAIENIKRGIEIGFKEESRCLYCYLILQYHPCYQSLHNDPRFVEILNKEKEKYELRLRMYGDF